MNPSNGQYWPFGGINPTTEMFLQNTINLQTILRELLGSSLLIHKNVGDMFFTSSNPDYKIYTSQLYKYDLPPPEFKQFSFQISDKKKPTTILRL